jgi:dihydrofolate reductase
MSVTLDGFTEGPNHELDDTAGFQDQDFDRYATEMLKSIDGMLIGRRTYELFSGYWPTAKWRRPRENELASKNRLFPNTEKR